MRVLRACFVAGEGWYAEPRLVCSWDNSRYVAERDEIFALRWQAGGAK